MIKTIPKKKKWLSEEALQIAEERREAKRKREEERYPSECRGPKNITCSECCGSRGGYGANAREIGLISN